MVCRRVPGAICNDSLMPQPWRASLLLSALANLGQNRFAGREFNRSDARFCAHHGCSNASSAAVQLFQRLRLEGLAWSEIGVDFSHLQHVRHPNNAGLVLADADVLQAVSVLDEAKEPLDARWSRVLWESDQPWRRPKCSLTSNVQPRMLRHLLRDGFVQVHDWGLDTQLLAKQAEESLRRFGKWGREKAYLTSRAAVPAIDALVNNETLAMVVRGYLGGPARFDGYATFSLMPNATVDSYISGHWHHDRCGRRLRLFVFTHDVDAAEMPTTQVARGSQDTVYFTHANRIGLTRFSDQYVRSRHEVVTLDGRAGVQTFGACA